VKIHSAFIYRYLKYTPIITMLRKEESIAQTSPIMLNTRPVILPVEAVKIGKL
jgi:hypothetical protein